MIKEETSLIERKTDLKDDKINNSTINEENSLAEIDNSDKDIMTLEHFDDENDRPDGDRKKNRTDKRPRLGGKTNDDGKDGNKDEMYEEFSDLAKLLNSSVKALKNEFIVFQIKKLMKKLGKVMVRYNMSEKELEKVFFMADGLSFGRVVLAPVNLPVCERLVRKNGLESLKVSSIIDFPFGESAFNSKVFDIKESKKIGVDEILVTLPTMLVNNVREFKKQCRKIGRLNKRDSGIVLNASDLDENGIKNALKNVAKSKVGAVTMVFGEATIDEVTTKMTIVNKYRGNKRIYAMANVRNIDEFMELNKLDVDMILTPYADEIGISIVKRFHIEGVKLD